MKRAYESPMLIFENFSPNEYVAACWQIACNHKKADEDEPGFPNPYKVWHRGGHCGTAGNQVFEDTNNDGIIDTMKEINVENYSTLPAEAFSDEGYSVPFDFENIGAGQTMWWTTKWKTVTWHHVGVVEAYEGKPNHS